MRNLEFRIGFAMTEYKVGATLRCRPKFITNKAQKSLHRAGRFEVIK